MIVKTICRVKKGEELLTTYGRNYWIQRRQFNKLTNEQKKLCKNWYKFTFKDPVGEV